MNPKCPYNDKECPKIKELENDIFNLQKEINNLKTDIQTISKYLYIIIGMVAINWGISIW